MADALLAAFTARALTDWRIASTNHTYDGDRWIRWWGPNNGGYEQSLDKAGVYELAELHARPDYYGHERLVVVPDYIARRLSGGALGVTNCTRTWTLLRQVALWQRSDVHLPAPWRSKAAAR